MSTYGTEAERHIAISVLRLRQARLHLMRREHYPDDAVRVGEECVKDALEVLWYAQGARNL